MIVNNPAPPANQQTGLLLGGIFAAAGAAGAALFPGLVHGLDFYSFFGESSLLPALWRWFKLGLDSAFDAPPQWLYSLPGAHQKWAHATGYFSTASAAAGGVWGYKIGATAPPAIQHLSGRKLSQNPADLKAEMDAECKITEPGIEIYPGVRISKDRETKGFLVIGAIGGGKTQILTGLIKSILARGDRVFLHDSKGDFTEGLLNLPGAVLIAPWDSRSEAWDIQTDTPAKIDAQELAGKVIEDTKEPIWADGARIVLTGLIGYLQLNRKVWDYSDIADLVSQPYEKMRRFAIEGNRRATLLLPEKLDKTTQGFIVNLVTSLVHLCSLGDAWGGKEKKFSIRKWSLDDSAPQKLVIAQSSDRYKDLSKSCQRFLLQAFKSCISEMLDSKSRKVWLILDEFPQMGQISEIADILAVGRSKGIRIVLGVQDFSQLDDLYGVHRAESFRKLPSTWIICKNNGDTQKLSEIIGTRMVRIYNPSMSGQPGTGGTINQGQRTDSWQIMTDFPVIPEKELTDKLGLTETGLEAVLITGGRRETVYRLIWPFSSFATVAEKALGHVVADWTRPGWPDLLSISLEKVNSQKAEAVEEEVKKKEVQEDLFLPPGFQVPAEAEKAGEQEKPELPELPEAESQEEEAPPIADEFLNEAVAELITADPASAALKILELSGDGGGESRPAPILSSHRRKLRRRRELEAEEEAELEPGD